MASYIASNAKRENVTVMLSRAEADALRTAVSVALVEPGELRMNKQTREAFQRAFDALSAATNISARRAGFFD